MAVYVDKSIKPLSQIQDQYFGVSIGLKIFHSTYNK